MNLNLTSGRIIRTIKKAGWYHLATHGDHWQFKHPEKPGKVTVPHPKKYLPPGTIYNIIRQTGMTKEEFRRWLEN